MPAASAAIITAIKRARRFAHSVTLFITPPKFLIIWYGRRARDENPQDFICVLQSRSEEHTSELQSLMRISYAVFCLKKKNIHETKHNNSTEQHHNKSTKKYNKCMTH